MPRVEEYVDRLRGQIESVQCVDELCEADMWSRHETGLWQAKAFVGAPAFYPVYRHGDLYSHSPLVLAVAKNHFQLDRVALRAIRGRSFRFLSGRGVLDLEVARLGGAMSSNDTIETQVDYATAIVRALRADIAKAESDNPEHTNVVLCGGKDSLNLLLLPWTNPTIVASARPNFDLVRNFVISNELDLEVLELTDAGNPGLLDCEVIENGCRNNLEHCRWGADLREIARRYRGKVVFWKGQLGDLTMTPKWREVSKTSATLDRLSRRVSARIVERLPASYRRSIDERWLEPLFRRVLWERGAMWQGAHVSLIRQISESLVLSAYHGPAMRAVFEHVSFKDAVTGDLRGDVGEAILGRPVIYPTVNPGPAPSAQRRGLSSPAVFLDLLRKVGVKVTD